MPTARPTSALNATGNLRQGFPFMTMLPYRLELVRRRSGRGLSNCANVPPTAQQYIVLDSFHGPFAESQRITDVGSALSADRRLGVGAAEQARCHENMDLVDGVGIEE